MTPPVTRRLALAFLGGVGLRSALGGAALAQGAMEGAPAAPAWRHGLSLLGGLKYPADFPHFAYVNPDAPRGGLARLGAQGTFDNFNPFVSGVKGDIENGVTGLVYDTLITQAEDEVGAEYGLLAEAVRHPDDYASVTYRLRAEGRFHDGRPVTPADVIFSFETLKRHSPQYAFYYQNVARAEETGEREVTFTFSEAGNRELPQIVGQIPVLSKAWWGEAPEGRRRDPGETLLETPLGSGPYRLKSFEAGRNAVYERVADYWGRDLPVNRGRHNFGEIRFEYVRDATVLVEALKGDLYDWRTENSARNWSTAYDVPAVREGRLVREEFPSRATGVMQAFALNLRRRQFQDERVRRAFNLAFDFEEINRTLFYGLYQRVDSYFSGTELASSGLPEGQELAILETVRDKVPAAVFTTPYANPVNGSGEAVRANLREAVRLMGEAGYELKGGRLTPKAGGEPLGVEFLGYDASLERYVLPYKQALERIGVGVMVRVVDAAQYQNRVRAFDFDITTTVWGQSLSPGNEQRDFWGSAAADRPGSRNLVGIRNPAVDALIERVVFAGDRPELIAATRALDRVLLANHYVVPQWTSRVTRTLRWNRFGRPERLPEYGGSGFPSIWWYDQVLAARTGAAR